MYATRPLSLFRKDPNSLSELTDQEGPNSGYVAITDEESEADDTCCFGTCKVERIKDLPFPQNKLFHVVFTVFIGDKRRTESKSVWFIPVIGFPLSSNRYYVVRALGRHKGQACMCSKEEDMSTCCFRDIVNDVTPRALDHRDIYQQVEIFKSRRGFAAKSVAPNGLPPDFLRRKGWRVNIFSSYHRQIGEALGLNVSLRMRHVPDFINFQMSSKFSKAEVVGRWYCPFVFIMDGRLEDQMTNSLFYEMTLEQTWEEIYTCQNDETAGNVVTVNVTVPKEHIKFFCKEAMKDETRGEDEFLWFRHVNNDDGSSLGLSLPIVEKMRWIQENGGCVGGGEQNMKVEKEFRGEDGWKRFGCYVLVERFSLRRMDRTLLLTYDFKHTHQIQSKWE